MRSVMSRPRVHGSSARAAAFDVHSLPVAVLVFSDIGLAHANRQWTALSGLSSAASCGDGWLAAVHPDDHPLMTSCTRPDGQSGGGQVRLRNVVDGTESWVQPQRRVAGSAANPIVVVTMTEIGTLKATQADLHYRARHDPMTGLLNKVAFLEEVDARLVAGAADDRHASVFFIDLDAFKSVNDQWGHAAGDQVLVTAAARIQATVRPNDLVGRLGGDELAVFQMTPRDEGVDSTAERLATVLAEPYAIDGRSIRVTASVGVATSIAAVRASTIVDRADRAMYRAKAVNRGNRSDDAEQRRAMTVPAAEAIATSAPSVDPLRTRPAAWDGPAWTDDDLWDGGGGGLRAARRLSRAALAVVAVTSIVLLGWVVRTSSVGSSSARAFAASVTASATTAGSSRPPATSARSTEQVIEPARPPVTTVVASSEPSDVPAIVELAPVVPDDSAPTQTTASSAPIVAAPADRPRAVAPTTPAPGPSVAAVPSPTAAAAGPPASIAPEPAPPAPPSPAPTTPAPPRRLRRRRRRRPPSPVRRPPWLRQPSSRLQRRPWPRPRPRRRPSRRRRPRPPSCTSSLPARTRHRSPRGSTPSAKARHTATRPRCTRHCPQEPSSPSPTERSRSPDPDSRPSRRPFGTRAQTRSRSLARRPRRLVDPRLISHGSLAIVCAGPPPRTTRRRGLRAHFDVLERRSRRNVGGSVPPGCRPDPGRRRT